MNNLIMGIFMSLWAQSGDLYSTYQELWQQYRKGETKSEQLLQEIDRAMARSDQWDDELLLANYTYLKGLIQQDISLLKNALSHYKNQSNDQGVSAASMELTRLLIGKDRLAEAEQSLKAMDANIDSLSIGHKNFYESLIQLKRGQYEDALVTARLSLAEFEKMKDSARVAQVNVRVALLLMLTGKMQEGYKLTLTAQAELVKISDQDQYFYSVLNLYFYQRCYKRNGVLILDVNIQKRLVSHPDDIEFQWLYTMLKAKC